MNRIAQLVPLALLAVAHLGIFPTSSFADEEEVPAPPFIQAAPEPSQWTIKIEYSSEDLDSIFSGDSSEEIIVKKATGLTYKEQTSSEGSKSTTWTAGGLVMEQKSDWPAGYLLSYPSETVVPDFFIPALGPDTFVRTESIGGTKCHYHETNKSAVPISTADPDEIGKSLTRVWIDARTRLPVRVIEEGSVTTTYEYRFAKSSDSLTLPPEFQERLRLWQTRPGAKNN